MFEDWYVQTAEWSNKKSIAIPYQLDFSSEPMSSVKWKGYDTSLSYDNRRLWSDEVQHNRAVHEYRRDDLSSS